MVFCKQSANQNYMQRIIIVIVFFMIGVLTQAQTTGADAASIKKQMSEIRKSTDWNNPEEAKKANAQIENLSAKLTQALRKEKQTAQPVNNQEVNQENQEVNAEIQQEIEEYNNELWNQMMAVVREGGAWDLAKPLRDQIVQEYKNDEDPTIKNAEWLETMPYLLINMSLPHIQTIINQMPDYKGVRKLIITCEQPGVSVNLFEILSNASDYPLEELHIVGFGSSVTSLPEQINGFSKLTTLSVYNNKLQELPESISSLTGLQFLYADVNPLASLLSVVSPLKKLKELGLAKTNIPDAEINKIQQLLPNCKILN